MKYFFLHSNRYDACREKKEERFFSEKHNSENTLQRRHITAKTKLANVQSSEMHASDCFPHSELRLFMYNSDS